MDSEALILCKVGKRQTPSDTHILESHLQMSPALLQAESLMAAADTITWCDIKISSPGLELSPDD